MIVVLVQVLVIAELQRLCLKAHEQKQPKKGILKTGKLWWRKHFRANSVWVGWGEETLAKFREGEGLTCAVRGGSPGKATVWGGGRTARSQWLLFRELVSSPNPSVCMGVPLCCYWVEVPKIGIIREGRKTRNQRKRNDNILKSLDILVGANIFGGNAG